MGNKASDLRGAAARHDKNALSEILSKHPDIVNDLSVSNY